MSQVATGIANNGALFQMTLSSVVLPLTVYAVGFQTLIYVTLPNRIRPTLGPVVTGAVGAVVTIGAAGIYGLQRIGLGRPDVATVAIWALLTLVGTSLLGWAISRREGFDPADPRVASLSPWHAGIQILIRIPIFTALIEEAFFRGLLHAALLALYPLQTAVWLGAGLFGVWHIGPALDQARAGSKTGAAGLIHAIGTVVLTTGAGLFLVWLRIDTGSIWAPAAVHAAVNMTLAVFARRAGLPWRTKPAR